MGFPERDGEEVIQYLRDHNMNRIALDKIAFRMRNEKEEETGRTFREDPQAALRPFRLRSHLWSYALYHKDVGRLKEYLSRSAMVSRCGLYLESPLLSLDPIRRGFHQHLEYKPLVNSRAHQLGKDRRILNDRLSDNTGDTWTFSSFTPNWETRTCWPFPTIFSCRTGWAKG